MRWKKKRKEDEIMIKVKLQKIIFATHFSKIESWNGVLLLIIKCPTILIEEQNHIAEFISLVAVFIY
jgi:hypothetical protein